MTTNPLDQAIKHFPNQEAFASALGVRSPSVSEWKTGRVPVVRCIAIEEATAGAVTRYDLRPDIFGPAPSKSEAA